jgi:hypothetical protein
LLEGTCNDREHIRGYKLYNRSASAIGIAAILSPGDGASGDLANPGAGIGAGTGVDTGADVGGSAGGSTGTGIGVCVGVGDVEF